MAAIPEAFEDIMNSKALAALATVMEDGRPQVTPVWFQWDGSHVLINSAEGRIKDRNMRRNPQVALTIVDVGNPYRHVAIRGTIDEITLEGADDHIDKLAKKYLDKDKYPFRAEGEVRVIYKVRPDRVATMG